MTFTLKLSEDYLQPAITCDRCGAAVASSGFQLWRPATQDADPIAADAAQICGDECLEGWITERDDGDEWLAISIDAYLANLIGTLDVDVTSVLAREQAVWAAEHTRHEAPD